MNHEHLPYDSKKATQRVSQIVALHLKISQSAAARLCQRGLVLDAKTLKPMKKGDLLPSSGLILHRPEPRKITNNPRPLEILFEDDALLYINKPAGLPSVPKNNDDLHGDSVAARLYDRFEWARAQALHDSGLCHRLDNDTSGILLAAKGPQKQKTLKEQWHEIDKGYLALMQGQLNQNTLETSAIMHHPKAKHKMITQSVSDASRTSKRDAATLFCPFQVSDHITLAGTFLKSPGHRHQIRVHALALGMPLCGDKVYGGPDNKSMLTHGLHATMLTLPGKPTVFAPLPSDFAAEMVAQGLDQPNFQWICERFIELSQK